MKHFNIRWSLGLFLVIFTVCPAILSANTVDDWAFSKEWQVEKSYNATACGLDGNGGTRSFGEITDLLPIPPSNQVCSLHLEIIGSNIVRLIVLPPQSGRILSSYRTAYTNIPQTVLDIIESERTTSADSFNRNWEYYVLPGVLHVDYIPPAGEPSQREYPLSASVPAELEDPILNFFALASPASAMAAMESQSEESSTPAYMWTRELGSSASDFGNAVIAKDDVYVVGQTTQSIDGQPYSGGVDIVLCKYSSAGVKQWTRMTGTSSGSTGSAYGRGLCLDSNAVYIGGYAWKSIDGQPYVALSDFCLIKYGVGGTREWVRMYGSSRYEYGTGVCEDSNGDIYLVGYTPADLGGTSQGGYNTCVVKYDSSGNRIWTHLIVGTGDQKCFGISFDGNTNLYIAGITYGSLGGQTYQGNGDFFLSKITTDGEEVWHRVFGTANEELLYQNNYGATCVSAAPDGTVYVTGSIDPGTGYYDAYLAAFDSDGTMQWSDSWGSSTYELCNAVAAQEDGSAVVGGTTYGSFDGQTYSGSQGELFISKYSGDGSRLWSRIWGSSTGDFGFGIAAGNDGSVYACGAAGGSVDGQTFSGGYDIVVTKWSNSLDQVAVDVVSIEPTPEHAVINKDTTLTKSDFVIVTDPAGHADAVDVSPLTFSNPGYITVTASTISSTTTCSVLVLNTGESHQMISLNDLFSLPLGSNGMPYASTVMNPFLFNLLNLMAKGQGLEFDSEYGANWNDWQTAQDILARYYANGFYDVYTGPDFSDGLALIFDPVNAVDGSFYVDETDLELAAPQPVYIQRSYNSQNQAPSELGFGWQLSCASYLFVNDAIAELAAGQSLPSDAEVRFVEFDGTGVIYARDASFADNLLTVTGGTNSPCAENTQINNYNAFGIGGRSNLKNNQVEYIASNQTFFVYSGNGTVRKFEWREFGARSRPYLAYEQQPNGNRLIYEYNTNGLLETLEATDPTQNTIFNYATFEYDADDRLVRITASDGRIVEYGYDEFSDLRTVTRPDDSEILYEYLHFTDTNATPSEYSSHWVTKVEHPGSRILENNYYEAGDNVGGETLANNDYRVGRVALQTRSIDSPIETVTNAVFAYSIETNESNVAYGSGHTAVFDSLGNKQVYYFDTNQTLFLSEQYVKIRDANGDPILDGGAYTYDLYSTERRYFSGDNLSGRTISDSIGSVRYAWNATYDDRGNLLSETEAGTLTGEFTIPLQVSSNGVPSNGETATTFYTYTYDPVENSNDPLNKVTSIRYPNDTVVRFEYDATTNGNLQAKFICSPDGDSDPSNNSIYRREFFEYNTNGVLTKIITDDGTSSDKSDISEITQRTLTEISPGTTNPVYGLPMEWTRKYLDGSETTVFRKTTSYNDYGYPLQEQIYDESNLLMATVSNAFDVFGQKLSETDPNGNTTVYQYDTGGQLTNTVTDLLETSYAYDYADRLLSAAMTGISFFGEQYAYDDYGNRLAETNLFGHTTSFLYDDLHRLTQTVLPEVPNVQGGVIAPVVTQGYDIFGNSVSATDPNSNTVSRTYTVRGQISEANYPDGTSEYFGYDEAGRLIQNTARNGTFTHYEYDLMDRCTNVATYSVSSQLLAQVAYTYNAFALQSVRDANGNTVTFTYDKAGRLSEKAGAGPAGQQSREQYVYDANSRIVEKKIWFGSQSNDFVSLQAERDAAGQIESLTTKTAAGATISSVSYGYNANGRCTNFVNEAGLSAQWEYDDLNRVVKQTRFGGYEEETQYTPDGSRTVFVNAEEHSLTKNFDALGRLLSISNAIGNVTSFAYDPAGNPVRRIDGKGEETDYQYDSMNRLTNVVHESVWKVSFAYGANGNLLHQQSPIATQQFSYDSMNRLTNSVLQVSGFEFPVSNRYDPNGNRTNIVYPGGKSIGYSYDEGNRLSSVDLSAFGLTSFTFFYDCASRLTNTVYPNGISGAFGYDLRNQVTNFVHGAFVNHAITREARGYKTRQDIYAGLVPAFSNAVQQTRAHNDADQLLSAGTGEYSYDANGNLSNEGMYEWDYNNRLVDAGGTEYLYDGSGARVGRIEGGATNFFVLDYRSQLKVPLAETDAEGHITRYYIWSSHGLLAHLDVTDNGSQITVNAVRYYHADEQGSILALTDENGTVTDQFAYSPYGQVLGRTGSTDTPYQWLGALAVRNEGDGLYYMLNRYYSADQRRFISTDPLGVDGGLNLYAYGNLNPLFYADPEGLLAKNFYNNSSYSAMGWKDGIMYSAIDKWGHLQELTIYDSLIGIKNGVGALISQDVTLYDLTWVPIEQWAGQLWRASSSGDFYTAGRLFGQLTLDSELAAVSGKLIQQMRTPSSPKISNPVPSNYEFVRVLKPDQVAQIRNGGNPFLSTWQGADDAFVATSKSIPSGLTRSQVAELLTIPEGNVGGIIRFQVPNGTGVATPINRFEIPGFINGGRTAGWLSEFVIPNQPVNNFNFMLEGF
jgi:RHS repeat-associated protein